MSIGRLSIEKLHWLESNPLAAIEFSMFAISMSPTIREMANLVLAWSSGLNFWTVLHMDAKNNSISFWGCNTFSKKSIFLFWLCFISLATLWKIFNCSPLLFRLFFVLGSALLKSSLNSSSTMNRRHSSWSSSSQTIFVVVLFARLINGPNYDIFEKKIKCYRWLATEMSSKKDISSLRFLFSAAALPVPNFFPRFLLKLSRMLDHFRTQSAPVAVK